MGSLAVGSGCFRTSGPDGLDGSKHRWKSGGSSPACTPLVASLEQNPNFHVGPWLHLFFLTAVCLSRSTAAPLDPPHLLQHTSVTPARGLSACSSHSLDSNAVSHGTWSWPSGSLSLASLRSQQKSISSKRPALTTCANTASLRVPLSPYPTFSSSWSYLTTGYGYFPSLSLECKLPEGRCCWHLARPAVVSAHRLDSCCQRLLLFA